MSQFNCLEFINPDITPEHGVTGYAQYLTQGPACAIAAGAATVYRNYFAKVGPGGLLNAAGEEEGVQEGQTSGRQLNLLAGLQAMLTENGRDLIEIKNGYTFSSEENLQTINFIINRRDFDNDFIDTCRDSVRIGLQYDAEVYMPTLSTMSCVFLRFVGI